MGGQNPALHIDDPVERNTVALKELQALRGVLVCARPRNHVAYPIGARSERRALRSFGDPLTPPAGEIGSDDFVVFQVEFDLAENPPPTGSCRAALGSMEVLAQGSSQPEPRVRVLGGWAGVVQPDPRGGRRRNWARLDRFDRIERLRGEQARTRGHR